MIYLLVDSASDYTTARYYTEAEILAKITKGGN
jgi:hypothetical protein